jgi:hypothetical protein
MSWDMVSAYCITNGTHFIAKTGEGEGKRYSVFDANASLQQAQGIFKTVAEAKTAAGEP